MPSQFYYLSCLPQAPLSKRCAIEMSKLTALNGFLSKIGKVCAAQCEHIHACLTFGLPL